MQSIECTHPYPEHTPPSQLFRDLLQFQIATSRFLCFHEYPSDTLKLLLPSHSISMDRCYQSNCHPCPLWQSMQACPDRILASIILHTLHSKDMLESGPRKCISRISMLYKTKKINYFLRLILNIVITK